MLAPNQTYYAAYEASTNLGFANQGTSILAFQLNGSLITGPKSEFNLSGLSPTFPVDTRVSQSSQAVFTTGAGTNIMTLNNTSGHALDVEGTNIDMVKLA